MIDQFKYEYFFLSNFYIRDIIIDDKVWKSTEHYFQAMKSPHEACQEFIRKLFKPSQTRKYGRRIKELRADWNGLKYTLCIKHL